MILLLARQKSNLRSLITMFLLSFTARTTRHHTFTFAFQLSPRIPSYSKNRLRRWATAKAPPVRQKALVIYGPNEPNDTDRPFQLVIVESPSKCSTISKILRDYVKECQLPHDYYVTSCMGHIRNLPKQKQKTEAEEIVPGITMPGYQPTYTIIPESVTLVKELKDWTQKASKVIFATDDDREGEAMAWHLLQVLNPEKFNRVRFTEITKTCILNSLTSPSDDLNHHLVLAQETRRVLDRLAGFTLSPVLWKTIAPGLSAGRVQSVGMALLVERERKRLEFETSEYWNVHGKFQPLESEEGMMLEAQMISKNGQLLVLGGTDFEPHPGNTLREASSSKLHLQNSDVAVRLLVDKDNYQWTVANITSTRRQRRPPEPFRTSTLQQEAVQRLGYSVSQTMTLAQQLYEQGFISYMRTDSNHLSEDAKSAIKQEIIHDFGGKDNYNPPPTTGKAKKQKKSSGNSTETAAGAHEAIRPAIQSNGRFAKPNELSSVAPSAERLYELIYRRTIASHLPAQISNATTIRILGESDDNEVMFRASGSVVLSPGFTMVYGSSANGEDDNVLPPLKEGQEIKCHNVDPSQHFSQPPPRYNEASFVKELEALGVGRPSTYAGTVQILKDRAYVLPNKKKTAKTKAYTGSSITAQRAAGAFGEDITTSSGMVPSLSAFVVSALLEQHCQVYVDPSFTAQMEERLDEIANPSNPSNDAERDEQLRIRYLDEFYAGENGLAARIQKIEQEVNPEEARRVSTLPGLSNNTDSDIGLFVGPWGPYIKQITTDTAEKPMSAQLPASMASDLSTITSSRLHKILVAKKEGNILGVHPDDGRNIQLKVARFGAYLQWGDDGEDGTTTHTLPARLRTMKDMAMMDDEEGGDGNIVSITLEEAIQYVNLPRTVCIMNDLPILAAIGPYGPYLKYNNTFFSLNPKDGDVLAIEAKTAQEFVQEQSKKKGVAKNVMAEIGTKEDALITVKNGRFGPYINWNKVNAKLPNEYYDNPEELPLEDAWMLIQEKEKAQQANGGTAEGRKKKKKQSSDVNLPPPPKRPLSAYLHFCAEKRPEVTENFSTLGEISKELARLWSETEDRQPYETMAEAGKSTYLEKKEVWRDDCQELLESNNNKSTKEKNGQRGKLKSTASRAPKGVKKKQKVEKKEKKKTKRSPSAYMLFCAAHRQSIVDENGNKLSLGETTKRLAQMWNECQEETKEEFVVQANNLKQTA
mmetsp:Transcript_13138/g.20406  ORF Transcript_13138/g.20406 Transcript_13138/m.20406 type:complete len:1212 (-) Transcript_13138:4354-7989(-)